MRMTIFSHTGEPVLTRLGFENEVPRTGELIYLRGDVDRDPASKFEVERVEWFYAGGDDKPLDECSTPTGQAVAQVYLRPAGDITDGDYRKYKVANPPKVDTDEESAE